MLALLACAAAVGCHDLLSTEARTRSPSAVGSAAHTVAVLDCTADVRRGTLACGVRGRTGAGAPSSAMLGQNQVRMASSGAGFDPATRVFRADVTTQNLLAGPIGTPDGATPAGVKVFFSSGPTATSFAYGDTGTVRVENPDGYGNFTSAHQPYFAYAGILAPGQVSAPREWRWYLSPSVSTFAFQVKVFAATPGEPTIPVTPPDSIPLWVFQDANMTHDDSPFMAGSFPRNVLFVTFTRGATEEEKQAALDAVHGEVVGGVPLTRRYAVRVASDAAAAKLFEAIAVLRTLPQVQSAGPSPVIVTNHLRPFDSPGWHRKEWKLDPDSAHGLKWGFERIAAPQAWGCTTGDSTVSISVVDVGFHAVSDLTKNQAAGVALGHTPGMVHGTEVTSIVAGFGNDSIQMTGMMWRAHLHLYDSFTTNPRTGAATLSLDSLEQNLVAAGLAADVINLSSAIYWQAQLNRLPYTTFVDSVRNPRRDSALVEAVRMHVRDALAELAFRHHDPLLVLSASNDGIDAYWSGTAGVVQDFPDRVLVVGASDIHDSRSSFSNWNPTNALVGVMAPGESVGVLDGSGRVVSNSGASFAAPFVAGLAGQLRSFDPGLSSVEVIGLIRGGAVAGGRRADAIPIVNAYESLRLAARRTGAPLCGNRVWIAGGHVVAQKDTADGSPPDTLFAVPADAEGLQVLHGGKRVVYKLRGSQATHLFTWTRAGQWAEHALTQAELDTLPAGPSFNSWWAVSHDGDTSAYVIATRATDEIWLSVTDGNGNYAGEHRLVAIPTPHPSSYGLDCGLREMAATPSGWKETCVNTFQVGSESRSDGALAYAPRGDRLLYAAYAWTNHKQISSDWYPCTGIDSVSAMESRTHIECRTVRTTGSWDRSALYSIDIAHAAYLELDHRDGEPLFAPSLADGADEFTLAESFGAYGDPSPRCETQYRSLARPTVVRRRADGCGYMPASFAPDRAAPPRLLGSAASARARVHTVRAAGQPSAR